MNQVIRRGAFETNSSSSHSITIWGGEFVPDTIPVEDGVCRIYPGEYGWEVADYHDAATKASYCLTYAKSPEPEDAAQLEMLRDVIQAEAGAPVEFVRESSEFYPWGYIDHQSDRSEGGACGAAFASRDALRQFIFNPKSILRTDNDNH